MHSTSPRTRLQKLVTAALAALFCLSAGSHTVAQSRSTRKIKYQVPPEYPQLAREMNLKGTARVMITVAADGTVKDVKELGGHPLLVDALVKAVRRWKYEPSTETTQIEIKTDFPPPGL